MTCNIYHVAHCRLHMTCHTPPLYHSTTLLNHRCSTRLETRLPWQPVANAAGGVTQKCWATYCRGTHMTYISRHPRHVTYYLSYITCCTRHISLVTHTMLHMTCHISLVTRHLAYDLSYITCYTTSRMWPVIYHILHDISHVTCHISHILSAIRYQSSRTSFPLRSLLGPRPTFFCY